MFLVRTLLIFCFIRWALDCLRHWSRRLLAGVHGMGFLDWSGLFWAVPRQLRPASGAGGLTGCGVALRRLSAQRRFKNALSENARSFANRESHAATMAWGSLSWRSRNSSDTKAPLIV